MDNTAIRSTLAGILQLTDDQLQRSVRYIVQPAEDKSAWEAVTEHCCLGGCNLEVYTFPTKRDALLFSALLQAAGENHPDLEPYPFRDLYAGRRHRDPSQRGTA